MAADLVHLVTELADRLRERIHGEQTGPGYSLAPSTAWQILKDAGTGPRRAAGTWRKSLTSQATTILAADLFHAGTVFLKRLYALSFIEHSTRRVHLAGITAPPRRRTGHPAGTQPPDDPGRPSRPDQVLDPRPRHQVHRRIRRGPHRSRHAHHQDTCPGTPGETSGCILHLFGSMRGVLALSWSDGSGGV